MLVPPPKQSHTPSKPTANASHHLLLRVHRALCSMLHPRAHCTDDTSLLLRLCLSLPYSRLPLQYILPYADSSHYKTLLKALNKTALVPVGAQETKDIETSIAGLRTDKLKQEREAVKEKKDAGKKKGLNLGRGGAGKGFDAMGDVDDYLDDGALDGDDDDYDFM